MKYFAAAAIMAVFAEASWHDFNIEVDGLMETKQIKSKSWSDIDHMDDEYCAKVPSNNSFTINNEPR